MEWHHEILVYDGELPLDSWYVTGEHSQDEHGNFTSLDSGSLITIAEVAVRLGIAMFEVHRLDSALIRINQVDDMPRSLFLYEDDQFVYGLGPYTHAMTQEMIDLEKDIGEARYEAWERMDARRCREIVAEVAAHVRELEAWDPPRSWREYDWWETGFGEREHTRRML